MNVRSLLLFDAFFCVFEAIKISIECLVRADIKVTNSVGFLLSIHSIAYNMMILIEPCHTQSKILLDSSYPLCFVQLKFQDFTMKMMNKFIEHRPIITIN